MKVEHTRQSLADLRKIAAHSRAYGEEVSFAVESRIQAIIARIVQYPKSTEPVVERPRHACGAAHSLSVQDILSRSQRSGQDTSHPAHGAKAVDEE